MHVVGITFIITLYALSSAHGEVAADSVFLKAVRQHADQIITHGRDTYGERHTPLFVDRLNSETHEAMAKTCRFHHQQNLLRLLDGLTELTGLPKYREAAADAVRHMMDHHRTPAGLFRWGGYVHIDLEEGRYRYSRNNQHSLRGYFPYYEFFREVDAEATAKFIRAFWNAHVLDWGTLETCRRGGTRNNWNLAMGALWDEEFGDPPPTIRSRRTLSFIHGGTDLIYAAGLLYLFEQEEGAWIWGERLARQYVRARHPETGLGVYQYNKLEATRSLPRGVDRLPTHTGYGDRAKNQFANTGSDDSSDEFYNPVKGKVAPDGMTVAREGWHLVGGRAVSIYVRNALIQLDLAERLGGEGAQLQRWTIDGMKSFAKHAYDAERNVFKPIWADGTDMSGQRIPVTGYYGRKGEEIMPVEADEQFLLSYSRAWRMSGDEELWEVVSAMARGLGLGRMDTEHAGPLAIFALIEIAQHVDDSEPYIDLAVRIAENLIKERFVNGYFVAAPGSREVDVGSLAPLALLTLEAFRSGAIERMPRFPGVHSGAQF